MVPPCSSSAEHLCLLAVTPGPFSLTLCKLHPSLATQQTNNPINTTCQPSVFCLLSLKAQLQVQTQLVPQPHSHSPWPCPTTYSHLSNPPLLHLFLPSSLSSYSLDPSLSRTAHSCHVKIHASCSDLTKSSLLSVDINTVLCPSSPPPTLAHLPPL